MITRTVREWTYEDVRKALEAVYGPVTGVAISQFNGYILRECAPSEQPNSASPEEPRVKEVKP